MSNPNTRPFAHGGRLPSLAKALLLLSLCALSAALLVSAANGIALTSAQVVHALLIAIVTVVLATPLLHATVYRPFQRNVLELERLAVTDPLTGASNRRRLDDLAETEFARAMRYGRGLSVLQIDVDHFKRINDTHGHRVGDEVLIQLTEQLLPVLRRHDVFARVGGDEFVVLLPETTVDVAEAVASRLLRHIRNIFAGTNGLPPVSISVGVAAINEDDKAWKDVLERADRALYRAKRGNREGPAHAPHGAASNPSATESSELMS